MSQAGTESQFIGVGGGTGGAPEPAANDSQESKDAQITLEGDSGGDGGYPAHTRQLAESESSTTTDSKLPAFSDFMNRNLDKDEVVAKKEEQKQEAEKLKPAQQPPPNLKPKPLTKDYTGIDDSLKPILSKMSNEAFDYTKKLIVENKELKEKVSKSKEPGALPDSYYEHEYAYTLTRDYEVLTLRNQIATNIEEHYANQLANIEAGEQWTKVDKINPDGSLTYSAPMDPSIDAKKYLIKEHMAASKQTRGESEKLDQYVSSFKNKHAESLGAIKAIKDTFFKGYDDAKHPAQALRKEVISGLPPAYQGHPLADIVAYAAYNNAVLLNQIKTLQGKNGVGKVQQSPTNKNFTGTTNNGARLPNFSDFKARLDR